MYTYKDSFLNTWCKERRVITQQPNNNIVHSSTYLMYSFLWGIFIWIMVTRQFLLILFFISRRLGFCFAYIVVAHTHIFLICNIILHF